MAAEEVLSIESDIHLASHRQQKMFERNPILYLTKKMGSAEVQLQKLTPYQRALFERAKAKEVGSFIKNNALRKCLNDAEIRQAFGSNRIIKARWVLTWKATPPDELADARQSAVNDKNTVLDLDGSRKAKARIVLLGFQHPSLLDRSFKTSAPVMSTIGRNIMYLLATHHQWPIHGLDLATAFLQTAPTEADQEIWTSGVKELRDALHLSDNSVMRVLRNIYGSTTAPRGLWLSLHRKLLELEATPIMGERCLWAWFPKEHKDKHGRPCLLGAMGGHVDDFHVVGNPHSPEWATIYAKILGAYKWGTAKKDNLKTQVQPDGNFKIVIDQEAYIETVADLDIPATRLREDGPLSKAEVGACRTAIGACQWLAIQTQPQLCARCNLLLTEVITNGTTATAKEIQLMIQEVRSEATNLQFFRLPGTRCWNDIIFISMGDQSHLNKPQGDSTGGLLTLAAGPASLAGKVTPMCLLAWRTWKLKRKAVGSNDAEV